MQKEQRMKKLQRMLGMPKKQRIQGLEQCKE